MNTIFYFAYGSNLHPMRLMDRVPSANLVGVVKHAHHRLTFHKKSKDGSGKCNIFATGSESDLVHGAIYKLNSEHKEKLDKAEGKGYGYIDNQISLRHEGSEYTCFTYLAQQSHIDDKLKPYHWYKRMVVLGAKYLDFPNSYISSIESVQSVEDPDETRRRENEILIEKILKYK